MNEQRTLDERYFDWLYSKIADIDARNPSKSYRLLLAQLYTTPFMDFIPNDHNRAWDGKELREEYMDEERLNYDLDWMELDCSFLEMLIALSKRASFQNGWGLSEWFWHLLWNLEIDKYHDEDYHDGVRIAINMTLSSVNRRTYEESGYGGLFPLKYPEADQREVEIAYQMSAYLIENDMTP